MSEFYLRDEEMGKSQGYALLRNADVTFADAGVAMTCKAKRIWVLWLKGTLAANLHHGEFCSRAQHASIRRT